MRGIKAKVTMERTLYVDLDEFIQNYLDNANANNDK